MKLESERLYLRPVELSDATEEYASWLNDSFTTQYLESGGRVETPESLREYIGRFNDREDALFLAIVLKDGDRHVGNLKFEPIRNNHSNATLGIMIGAPEARGKGVGKEAIKTALEYLFTKRKLHRVNLFVASDNKAAIRCYENIGFVLEGRARQAVSRGSYFVDDLMMGILASEFIELPT